MRTAGAALAGDETGCTRPASGAPAAAALITASAAASFASSARMVQRWVVAPFDSIRHLRAASIRAGWQRPSMLADREFEGALAALERQWLGPWARRV